MNDILKDEPSQIKELKEWIEKDTLIELILISGL